MGLRFVYGRTGTGKSTFCFEEIAQKIDSSKSLEKIYIITPEQFSFTAEKKLMQTVKKKAVLQAEVLTFERMAYRVMNEVGGVNKTRLSAIGKAMLVHSILHKKKKDLKFLGKTEENVELVCKTITEMKKHTISPELLMEKTKEVNNSYLKAKLEDISLIYTEFQNILTNHFIDENDTLSILGEQLTKTKMFENCEIYLDEFAGFTPQEYTIISLLAKQAKSVTITLCMDKLEEPDNPDKDVFFDNKITWKRLQEMAHKENIVLETPINLMTSYRFKSRELKFLEENWCQLNSKPYSEKTEDIEIFLAKNPYSEIERVAEKINLLVKKEGLRYQEIAVITKNLDTYSNLVKAIFEQYEIPIFIDEKRDLSQNLLVKYVLSILEIFTQNWSLEAVFGHLKSGFLPEEIEKEEIFKLENYCISWGIKGNKWYLEDWHYGETKEEEKKQVERFNVIRKQIVEPLLELKRKLQQAENSKQMTSILYEFLLERKIEEEWNKKIEQLEEIGQLDLANEYRTSWKILLQVLDEMVMLFEEEKLSFEKYLDILKVGLHNSDLGRIPGTQDQVILGDVDRSRSHKVNVIFLIGVNDGGFPSNNKEEGFLNDEDREKLKAEGMELAKTTIERLYEDNFNIYRAFTTAEKKLVISYCSSDFQGTPLRGSVLLPKIKRLFPSIKQESNIIIDNKNISTISTTFDLLIEKLEELKEGKKIEDIWYTVYSYYEESLLWKERLQKSMEGIFYTNEPEKIKKEMMQKLYGDTLKTSVSKLEQYQSCPFSFYLKYILKLEEKEKFKMKSIDTGSFMHEVMDAFFTEVRRLQKDIKELQQEEIEEIVNRIIEEKLNLSKNYIFTSTQKFRVLTGRLKRVVKVSLNYIIQSLQESDFEVIGNEIQFERGKDYPPIRFNTDEGKSIEIIGKIDRVDMAKMPDGKYIRIIDYKSSIKNIDLNEVMAGLQIQLLTYLDATCKIEEVLPAGVLYFNLLDPMIKTNKRISKEELELELKKKFKMNGLILADINIVKKMDTSLEKGSSIVIPAYIDKEGNLSKSKSNAVTKQQFEVLQKYIRQILVKISKEIMEGDISIKPYYNPKNKKNACEYCIYQSICQFQKGFCGNDYQYIGQDSKEEVLEKIAKRIK